VKVKIFVTFDKLGGSAEVEFWTKDGTLRRANGAWFLNVPVADLPIGIRAIKSARVVVDGEKMGTCDDIEVLFDDGGSPYMVECRGRVAI